MKMKNILSIVLVLLPLTLGAQVVDFAKTLPVRSFSLGISPSFHMDNGNIGLRSIGVSPEENGSLGVTVSGGYGLLYSLDLGVKYMYMLNGTDYFGVNLQYLVHEARHSYFSVIGGLHRWDGYGIDLTGLFTYAPNYTVNISGGLDMDLNYDTDMESNIRTRFWVPLNVGFNVNDLTFIYGELNVQVSQLSWSIVALGANFIFR